MKKINLIFSCIALVALLLSSCSKEQNTLNNITQETPKEQTTLDMRKVDMLSFDSKDDMLKIIFELSQMDVEKRNEWYKAKGNFESQDSFMWAVIDELIDAKSVEEVRNIQAEYSAFFLWNNNEDDEDMNPYIPSNVFGSSLVCNRNGEVLIAGEIINFNTLSFFKETYDYKQMESFKANSSKSTINEWNNHLYVSNGSDRRFWGKGIHCYIGSPLPYLPPGMLDPRNRSVYVDFYAEKKAVFWVKYTTNYFVKVVSSSNWISLYLDFGTPNMSTGYFETGNLLPHTERYVGQSNGSGGTISLRMYSGGTSSSLQGTLNIAHPDL